MADVRRLTEIEGGRWAWVLEVTPEPEAPSGAWCPLNERGCAGECRGELCMAARQARTDLEDR